MVLVAIANIYGPVINKAIRGNINVDLPVQNNTIGYKINNVIFPACPCFIGYGEFMQLMCQGLHQKQISDYAVGV